MGQEIKSCSVNIISLPPVMLPVMHFLVVFFTKFYLFAVIQCLLNWTIKQNLNVWFVLFRVIDIINNKLVLFTPFQLLKKVRQH